MMAKMFKLFATGRRSDKCRLGYYRHFNNSARQKAGIVSALDESQPKAMAKVIMQDVYIGLEKQLAEGSIKRGDIKQIRIVESLGKQNEAGQGQVTFCWQFPVVSGGATMEPKKLFRL